MKIKRRSLPAPHIPFISLADIAWQVIIFFFMASSFTKLDAMKIDAPSTSPQAPAQTDKPLIITATTQSVAVDGQAVTMDRLGDELNKRLKDRKKPEERVVIVEGRDDLTFQRDVEVMYAIQKAGGVPVISEEK